MSARHRVALCTLGGTIAAFPHAGGPGVLPGEQSPSLRPVIEQLLPGVEITERSLAQVPSAAIDFDLLRCVIAHAEAEVAAGASGVVVTTGTDTLEEVAFALDLMWSAPAPLIVTGAMRHPGAPGADGPANLVGALRVATDPAASDAGVVVVMNDRIHVPSQVQKRHTSHVDAFVSAAGPLGDISEGVVYLHTPPPRRRPLGLPDGPFPPVALLRTAIGDDGRLLPHLVDVGYRGLVIEAAGGGSTPPSWAQPLEQIARHIPVLYAGRPGTGPALRSTYGGVGGEIDLQRRGLIPAGLLDGLKTRVLLTILLATGADIDLIRRTLAHPTLHPSGNER
ncbi:asparaginase [Rhodococcus sp. NPDC057529]|uniref:asparaginase n=1 Tax=Rhodococcus sp. NPDC057529 TaxID=3346158 RepID=UPI00366CEFF0